MSKATKKIVQVVILHKFTIGCVIFAILAIISKKSNVCVIKLTVFPCAKFERKCFRPVG